MFLHWLLTLLVMRSSPEIFFDDLNRDILKSLGDGKIIVIDDSDDNEEAQEEGTTDIDPLTVPAFTADAPAGPVSLIVMLRGSSRRSMVAATANIASTHLRL
jgi:hypothetical protein